MHEMDEITVQISSYNIGKPFLYCLECITVAHYISILSNSPIHCLRTPKVINWPFFPPLKFIIASYHNCINVMISNLENVKTQLILLWQNMTASVISWNYVLRGELEFLRMVYSYNVILGPRVGKDFWGMERTALLLLRETRHNTFKA